MTSPFFRTESIPHAFEQQFNFLENVFVPIVNNVDSAFHLSATCIGSLSGNNRSKIFKEIAKKAIKTQSTITKSIYNGLAKVNNRKDDTKYVSFFVFTHHGSKSKSTDRIMDFHSCVYTMRCTNGVKDVVYFDPSIQQKQHPVPQFLKELRSPKHTLRRAHGSAFQRDDCFFQCMRYITALHAGQLQFGDNFLT